MTITFNNLNLPSPITPLHNSLLTQKNIQLFVKRDELIHPTISGNKWRKLKYNLIAAQQKQQDTILSFGGAYSNHLHALAAAGKQFGFKTIGIVRGEQKKPLNPCLQDMLNWGMHIEFVTRINYKQKTDVDFIQQLRTQFGAFHLIPEGGNNALGFQGCAELLDELKDNYDFICCEVGSGTMMSSLILNCHNQQTKILGFSVMKNPQLDDDIKKNIAPNTSNGINKNIYQPSWEIIHPYHFGGFAKTTTELNDFINQFKRQHNIQLEPVYSGKMLYGINDLIEKNYFKKGTRILAIHGGGLQGIRGFSALHPALHNNTK